METEPELNIRLFPVYSVSFIPRLPEAFFVTRLPKGVVTPGGGGTQLFFR